MSTPNINNMDCSPSGLAAKFNGALLAINAFALVFIWFEATWLDAMKPFRNIFIATSVMWASNTDFFPANLRSPVLLIGTFVFIYNIEICVNKADHYMNVPADKITTKFGRRPSSSDVRVGRCGAVLALLTAFPMFILNYLWPLGIEALRGLRMTIGEFMTDKASFCRFIGFIGAAISFLMAQAITWGIKDSDTVKIPHATIWHVRFLLMAFFLIISALAPNSKVHTDLAIFLPLSMMFNEFAPIFDHTTSPVQSTYPSLWRAQLSFAFIGAALVWCSTMMHSFIRDRNAASRFAAVSLKSRVTTPQFGALLLTVPIGIIGAGIVIHQDHSSHSYEARRNLFVVSMLGFVMPLFNMLGWVLRFPAFSVAILIQVFPLFMSLLAQINMANENLTRCGLIMVIISASVAPLLMNSETFSIPSSASDFVDESRRQLFMLCGALGMISFLFAEGTNLFGNIIWWNIGLLAALLFCGSSGQITVTRVVFLFLLTYLVGPKFDTSTEWICFVLVGWFAIYSMMQATEGQPFCLLPFYSDSETEQVAAAEENGTAAPLMPAAPGEPLDPERSGAAYTALQDNA